MVKIEINYKLLDKHIEKISKSIHNLLKKYKTKFHINKNTIECLKYLSNEKELKNILSIQPCQMRYYVLFFRKYFPNSMRKNTELNKILREIFEKEYKNWTTREKYGAYYFVKVLNLKSCPYCNRNYTFTVVNKNGKMRPQIDHFYPKSKYPFFAMSFFNLIPSCPSCNHTKKEKFNPKLINPYELEINDLKFSYKPNKIDFIEVEKNKYNFDSFDVSINGNKKQIELFQLEELYKQHKDIVLELLVKKVYYPESYIKELADFGFSEDEIYRYLFANYKQEKDLHKRPLSKLIKDISQELGLV